MLTSTSGVATFNFNNNIYNITPKAVVCLTACRPDDKSSEAHTSARRTASIRLKHWTKRVATGRPCSCSDSRQSIHPKHPRTQNNGTPTFSHCLCEVIFVMPSSIIKQRPHEQPARACLRRPTSPSAASACARSEAKFRRDLISMLTSNANTHMLSSRAMTCVFATLSCSVLRGACDQRSCCRVGARAQTMTSFAAPRHIFARACAVSSLSLCALSAPTSRQQDQSTHTQFKSTRSRLAPIATAPTLLTFVAAQSR